MKFRQTPLIVLLTEYRISQKVVFNISLICSVLRVFTSTSSVFSLIIFPLDERTRTKGTYWRNI